MSYNDKHGFRCGYDFEDVNEDGRLYCNNATQFKYRLGTPKMENGLIRTSTGILVKPIDSESLKALYEWFNI